MSHYCLSMSHHMVEILLAIVAPGIPNSWRIYGYPELRTAQSQSLDTFMTTAASNFVTHLSTLAPVLVPFAWPRRKTKQ